jgi:glucose/arabinose dehydrogenase/mono/diheme cytochrome c family protein
MNRSLVTLALITTCAAGLAAGLAQQGGTAQVPGNVWPPAKKPMPKSIPLSPQEELQTFSLPPGFHAELVASDPMIDSPILMDFDPDGRLWVIEMLTFLPDLSGRDSTEPLNRVSVLEDTDGDGKMDKKTVFADGLKQARALKVLDHGVLVGEPPNLWLLKDTDGDLKADTKELVTNTFGNGNGGIEHNANSLYWAMDNVMYSSEHVFDLKLRNGKFESLPALSRGQWTIAQDDAGRVYRNVNDSPLFVDYTPSRYFIRNPNAARTRGLYELLIEQADATVYPVRDNRGVNRGYRDPFFRADGSSIVIQGASGPIIYRGDTYPKELRGNAFIPDSPTNLVHRMVVADDGSGRLKATNGYARGEFIASSDERFRPVSLYDGPDGDIYVVDMYRGVVQAGGIWTEYLTDYIKAHDLQLPTDKGRIWRIVYGNGRNAPRAPKPSLSKAPPAQLVDTLSNPKGWWRDTAQRLLVERGDASVVPALKTLAGTAPDWRTKLHALWTLDGLDAIDAATVQKALADPNPDVRASAVRLSERWLGKDAALGQAVVALIGDKSWNVRRQVAASMGEMPAADRVAPAVSILTRYGDDPIVVDATLSSLNGVEADVLARVMQEKTSAPASAPGEAVTMLAAAVAKAGDVASVQHVIDTIVDASRPEWERTALLKGLDAGLPARGAGGRGGRGGGGGGGGGLPGLSAPGGRVVVTPGRGVSLPAEPAALTAMAAGNGAMALLARNVTAKLDWPGRPAPVVTAAPLTADQQKRYDAGAEIYKNICMGCHQEDGKGKEKLGANLVDSQFVNAPDATATIRILMNGKEGTIGLMPPLGPSLSDEQIASALTYIRRAWGHTAAPVEPLNVMEVRGLTKSRSKPWTNEELQAAGRGGRGGGH